ncbi:dTDP-4-dehydrorhamnose 3,5-epimerase [Pseudovibrio sp. SPO723]|uniref:dTDP-4-dehydrorhamnose 3,5-epimerase n=1 Tax=Nesiotobacter zosterae TaxID=392721 RepID=UPI0029C400ED|nr:dTDP-4-dehydrorhamnose 3,5-epimerase [Pseudovibrio sp. SPO723]MDX5593402.1 dTDP-4-dehydrorhamnose 3,5-epimerase [Pseudovibrio sp. SPO723]
MQTSGFERLDISDVFLITPKRFGDARGFFTETYNKQRFEALSGLEIDFVQDNCSYSSEKGTLRGLHFQLPPYDQAKLVSVNRGAIFDVAVDFRKGSPTFGRWVSAILDAAKGQQIFVPRGFLHGFVTLQEDTEVSYKVDNYYSAEHDAGVMWNDEQLGIAWPECDPILSTKDRALPRLSEVATPFSC